MLTSFLTMLLSMFPNKKFCTTDTQITHKIYPIPLKQVNERINLILYFPFGCISLLQGYFQVLAFPFIFSLKKSFLFTFHPTPMYMSPTSVLCKDEKNLINKIKASVQIHTCTWLFRPPSNHNNGKKAIKRRHLCHFLCMPQQKRSALMIHTNIFISNFRNILLSLWFYGFTFSFVWFVELLDNIQKPTFIVITTPLK